MNTFLRNLGLAAGVFLLAWLAVHASLAGEFTLLEKARVEEPDTIIDRLGATMDRVTFVYLPLIALGTCIAVGILGRGWRWAWLTASIAGGPVTASYAVSFVAEPSYLSAALTASSAGLIVVVSTLIMWRREIPPEEIPMQERPAPNTLVSRDRNPRERGFRPVNSDR